MIYNNTIKRAAVLNCALSARMDTNKMRHVHNVLWPDIQEGSESDIIRIASEVMTSLRMQGCFKNDFATEYRIYTNLMTVLYIHLSRGRYERFVADRNDVRNMFAVPYSQLWNAIA